MATETNIFRKTNEEITDDLKKELRLQGHYLTGNLERSIIQKEIAENGGVTLTASSLEYLKTLEEGLLSNQIDHSAKGINEMTRYVELRMGYSGKKAVKVALLILKRQSKEGNPTLNSYQFSKTGERTEVVKETFLKNESRYGSMVDTAVIGQLDNQFHQIKSGTI